MTANTSTASPKRYFLPKKVDDLPPPPLPGQMISIPFGFWGEYRAKYGITVLAVRQDEGFGLVVEGIATKG